MEIGKSSKIPPKFCCELCNYFTCYSKDYKKHELTKKHMEMNGTIKEIKKVLICKICEKEFKTNAGLWKHKQKCNSHPTNAIITKQDEPSDKEVMCMLIKQNSELIKEHSDIKEMILEIIKNGITNTNTNTNSNNNTHTNSHNKAFNLNFFLNETCKNAMNITDFVDSIKLQLSDLMEVGELGYVEGISKIIVKNLNNLDETVRPVHCTDKKRETMYIKDEGEWNKEDEKKSKLKKVITRVANKNIRLLPQFREKYPDYGNSSSKTSDIYHKMIVEAMETDDDKKEKIIKNISKVTTIKE
jgi:hypothetical protein